MGTMQMENRLQLACVLHGAYEKFITDDVKTCPSCSTEKAQIKQNQHMVQSKISQSFEKTVVKIHCDEHGIQKLEVPEFLRKVATKCPVCVEQKRLKKLAPKINALIDHTIQQCGIPQNNIGMAFSTMDATRSPKQQAITARLITYVKDLVAAGQSDGAKNILLSGNMGTGKTAYASAMLEAIIRRSLVSKISDENDLAMKGGLSVLFISEPSLIHAITATWGQGAKEKTQDLINRLSSKSILCIDDVGATTTTHTHLLDAYAAIIDERYKRKLPTIMTSNLNHEDIRLAIGARSADRFMEKNRIIIANFDWKGYRSGQMGTNEIEMF